jgi:hypothetical protein
MSILVLHHSCARISSRSSDNPLSHFMEISRDHRFRECELPSKDRRNSDFVWLDVDIRGDN